MNVLKQEKGYMAVIIDWEAGGKFIAICAGTREECERAITETKLPPDDAVAYVMKNVAYARPAKGQ